MNTYKTTFEKSSERGPKRKIRMWEYDVKKGEQ